MAGAASNGTGISRVGIVGCGLMGSGIAEVCARAALEVTVVEQDGEALEAGRQRVKHSLDRALKAGKISPEDRYGALRRLTFSTDLADLADRQLVVEAVIEAEPAKVEVFSALDKVVTAPDAVLATNTSSIPIMKLAMATSRPASVVGVHFFNPVPVMPLVELVSSLLTEDAALAVARAFVEETLGKTVIASKDRAGFVVNALLIPYLLSAVRMMESGFATPEDIDTGMVLGCHHPMGPLALIDLIGVDTTVAVAQSLYEEFKEQLYAPPPLLLRMSEAGLMGRKCGRGFYEYNAG